MQAVTGLTDRELVARCRGGDDEAWNQLVERFSRYVYAICSQGFRFGPQDADDVFQDVFAKVFEQLGRLRDDGAVRPWIAQLTRRTCIDKLRGAGGGADRGRARARRLRRSPGRARRRPRRPRAARDAPEACQEILDRFFARDESYKTIGEALDLPAGTIASRISRCLERLKSAMEDSGAEPRHVDG